VWQNGKTEEKFAVDRLATVSLRTAV